MDLVDIARAVFRWWYVVLALLALGGVLALGLASSVEPTYEVQSQTLFVGPQRTPALVDPTTGEIGDPDNPYLQFSGSLEVTSEAVARTVDGTEFRTSIYEEGLDGEFTFEGSSGAPLITTISTADDPDDARALTERVVLGLEETLAELQADAGVPTDEQITMRTLTISDPSELLGNRNRVLVGVLAVSVIAAIAAAVLLDSIQARRRAARPADGHDFAIDLDDRPTNGERRGDRPDDEELILLGDDVSALDLPKRSRITAR
jgi:hypothetical protein